MIGFSRDAIRLMIATTTTTARRHACIIENRQNRHRPAPGLNIDFLAQNSLRRFEHLGVAAAVNAKFAVTMRRRFHADRGSTQMCDMAQEINRTFSIAVLHLTVRRTHSAERLDPALRTLRRPGALLRAHRIHEFLPALAKCALANFVGVLLRDGADAHLAIRIDRQRLHTSTAEIHRIHVRQTGRAMDIPFGKLAVLANGMLDGIEILAKEMASVGNEIAHDLRTPLTRVRVGLERGRANAKTLEELQLVTDRAIGGVDQSLIVITALLRITEIENSRGRASFGEASLADIVREVGELYEPIADDKHVALSITSDHDANVSCDRSLLLEAVANLVDNAIKFTPEGGCVDLALIRGANESIVRIEDTGPGIGEGERDVVMRRFYRSDKSRNSCGAGLGLSLVSAIVKLHGLRFTLTSGPGCVAEIGCPIGPASTSPAGAQSAALVRCA